MISVAKNTKRIIKEKCLSQGAIANKAGYDGKVFSNMLNGRKKVTDIDIIRISQALNVEPNELFGITRSEKKEPK